MTAHASMEMVVGDFPVPTAVVDGKLSQEQMNYWEKELQRYNPADVQMFFWSVEKYKLNPFGVAQIYPLPIDGKLVTHVGINGLVLLAQRTGLYAGMTEPVWCAQPKDMETHPVWRDFWNYTDDNGRPLPPAAAKVGVAVRGHAIPSYAVANWSEAVRRTKDGRPMANWFTMPAKMLAKVAAAEALRRTFQQEFADLKLSFSAELGERPPRRAPVISDLYSDTPDTTRRPKLTSGFDAEPDPEEGQYREVDKAPPVVNQSAERQPARQSSTSGATGQRQGKEPDGATAFWSAFRALGLSIPHDFNDCIGADTVMAWMNQDKAKNTWPAAIAKLEAKHGGSGSSPSIEERKEEPASDHEAAFYHRAAELGYQDGAAARDALVLQMEGGPWEQLLEQFGWEMLTELLDDNAPAPAADDATQPTLLAMSGGDPVDQRKRGLGTIRH